MRKSANIVTAASAVALLMGTLSIAPMSVFAAEEKAEETDPVKLGKSIAEDRKKGNCFTCHAYEGASLPGNMGPPLVAMKARFPDKEKLRAQIFDATKANPNTVMPPFGKNEVLSKKDIDAIVEWVYTL